MRVSFSVFNMKNRQVFSKKIKLIGIVLLGLFLVVNLLLAFQAYRFTYFYESKDVPFKKLDDMSVSEKLSGILFGFKFPKRTIDTLPSYPFETVLLKNKAGLQLEGWYVKADSVAKGTVILFHGHGSCKQKVLAEANFFHGLGYNTLAMDLQAHGRSEGNVCTIGYQESEDVNVAYQYIAKLGEKNIVLWGMSLGAAVILKAVPEYHLQPSKIIAECSFASLSDAVKGKLRMMHVPETPISQLLLFWGSAERGFWGFNHQPAEYVKGITSPTLIHWGAKDPRVSREETLQLYENLASPSKKLVVFDTSQHQSFCKSEPAKWEESVKTFLE